MHIPILIDWQIKEQKYKQYYEKVKYFYVDFDNIYFDFKIGSERYAGDLALNTLLDDKTGAFKDVENFKNLFNLSAGIGGVT